MNKQSVLIIGSSGLSKVIIDIFEKEGKYQISGLVDDFRNIGEETLGYNVVGKVDDLPDLLSNNTFCEIFIAIGDNWNRQKVMNRVLEIIPNIDFVSAIHPSVQIGKNVKIGKGVVIMAGAIINSDTDIGDFAIINVKASISHDCKMFKFSSLGPNVTIGGYVTIGEFSAICIGATVKDRINIGKHSIIGAGSLLLKDCEDNVVMYGVPAKMIRKREIGEKYL